jgi:hypothetical protein
MVERKAKKEDFCRWRHVFECDGWKDGKANGKDKMTFRNGSVFEGEFKN